MMVKRLGENKQITKTRNRGLLLQLLATKQCKSRIEIAQYMQLSRMAVTNMVNELIERGFLVDGSAEAQENSGRRPVTLEISPSAPKVIGILVFRDRCEAVLCDLYCNIIKRFRITMGCITAETLIHSLYELVDTILSEENTILGLGVSCIGPIDAAKGVLLNPCYFYDITNVPIVEKLKEKYDFPIFMENDNQCGALAEKLYGIGKEYRDILLIGIGTGVGSGLIMNDTLYENTHMFVPEFGHTSISADGRECACGRKGCIQSYISTDAMLVDLRSATGKFYSFKKFCEMDDDKRIDNVFRGFIEKLSFALINVINILNSELVILAHDGAYFSDKQLYRLEEHINAYKFTKTSHHVKVERPFFKGDAQLIGAVCLVLSEVFQGNLCLTC